MSRSYFSGTNKELCNSVSFAAPGGTMSSSLTGGLPVPPWKICGDDQLLGHSACSHHWLMLEMKSPWTGSCWTHEPTSQFSYLAIWQFCLMPNIYQTVSYATIPVINYNICNICNNTMHGHRKNIMSLCCESPVPT